MNLKLSAKKLQNIVPANKSMVAASTLLRLVLLNIFHVLQLTYSGPVVESLHYEIGCGIFAIVVRAINQFRIVNKV